VEIKYDIYNDELLANYYNKRFIILNSDLNFIIDESAYIIITKGWI